MRHNNKSYPLTPPRPPHILSELVYTSFETLGASMKNLTFVCAVFCLCGALLAHEQGFTPKVAPASDEAEQAIKGFKVLPGFKVDLFAAEPMLAHPVAFCTDELGRFYVAETFRFADGINGGGNRDFGGMDMRGHMDWLDIDLASTSIDDRVAMYKKGMTPAQLSQLTVASERVRLIIDKDGDGKADTSTVFAEGFNRPQDGIAAGVFARKGSVWFTCIPDLWLLKDTKGEGKADVKKSLLTGFGVRIAFLGHDLHGICMGPDGKLYFSIGDRGFNVKSLEGKTFSHPECGAAFRCNPDGTEMELLATGLRNPQELAFDDYGNLFTGDNNADHGDSARWVWILEGGDSGWRGGYQYIRDPNILGPWHSEKIWHMPNSEQPAHVLPPVGNLGVGPSGIAHYPGVGLPESFKDAFFYCDYRGGGGGVLSFKVKPKGAGFEVIELKEFFWRAQATDVLFGVDGAMYTSLWYGGIDKTGKGRIYKISDPVIAKEAIVAETKKLLAEDLGKRDRVDLLPLLSHKDQRVRTEAQFALVEKGDECTAIFHKALGKEYPQMARIHAMWGLGMRAHIKKCADCLDPVIHLLKDEDAEIRAQAAKVLGDAHCEESFDFMLEAIKDSSLRVRVYAALALGKIGRSEALEPVLAMLRENADKDPFVRHAGVMALTWLSASKPESLMKFAADESSGARMGVLLALRRHQHPAIAKFLTDKDPLLVLEAARAINDAPINEAMPELAKLARPVPLPELEKNKVPYSFTAEFWENIGGILVADLLKNPDFPAKPTTKMELDRFEIQPSRGDNYGTRVHGLLTAPATGEYTFWIASDDAGELFLSTDEKPENKTMIATTKEWAGPREWEKTPEQKSKKIKLTAGQRYYIEALHKEGGGLDALAVGWQLPDGKMERPIGANEPEYKPSPLMRRAMNAAFRSGQTEHAKLLAEIASRNDLATPLRAEALSLLSDWAAPPLRDRIINLHRPLPKRDGAPAAEALGAVFTRLLQDKSEQIKAAAAQAAGKLQLKDAGAALNELAIDDKQPVSARVEALRALALLNDKNLNSAVSRTLNDPQLKVREESSGLLAKLNPTDAVPVLATILETASIPEKQSALMTLGKMNALSADALLAVWMEKVLAGTAAPEIQLDVLEASRVSKNKPVAELYAKYIAALPKDDELAPFKTALSGGNADAGKRAFYENPTAQCIRCHKINGQGGDVGPDLKGIATKHDKNYLLESIVSPSKQIAEGFETTVVKLNDGRVVVGLLKVDGEKELTITGADGKTVAIKKADIKQRMSQKVSTMPPMGETLSKADVRNLVEFLSTLK